MFSFISTSSQKSRWFLTCTTTSIQADLFLSDMPNLCMAYLRRSNSSIFLKQLHTKRSDNAMGKEVLIVDDSATVRKFVSVSLSMQGFSVVAACDGMDALEKISKGKFNLVITDLNMPTMDGLEFIKALR